MDRIVTYDMATVLPDVNASDLRPTDAAILDELQKGARTKGALVDATGYSRNTIYNRLEVLEAGDVVECIHEPTRLWELADDPRDD
jgi:DNA-binding transcriptional ArsR family regulator